MCVCATSARSSTEHKHNSCVKVIERRSVELHTSYAVRPLLLPPPRAVPLARCRSEFDPDDHDNENVSVHMRKRGSSDYISVVCVCVVTQFGAAHKNLCARATDDGHDLHIHT